MTSLQDHDYDVNRTKSRDAIGKPSHFKKTCTRQNWIAGIEKQGNLDEEHVRNADPAQP